VVAKVKALNLISHHRFFVGGNIQIIMNFFVIDKILIYQNVEYPIMAFKNGSESTKVENLRIFASSDNKIVAFNNSN
jgi:hypothetical protein